MNLKFMPNYILRLL